MYTITFIDGTTFQGGSPANSLWSEIPKKPIKSISYSLTPFLTYLLTDFESYCHLVERVRGVNTSLERITKVIIMGRTKNRVYQVLLDSTGSVYQIVVSAGKEYSPTSKMVDGKFAGWENGKPLTGYLEGVQDGSPKLEKITTKAA